MFALRVEVKQFCADGGRLGFMTQNVEGMCDYRIGGPPYCSEVASCITANQRRVLESIQVFPNVQHIRLSAIECTGNGVATWIAISFDFFVR